MQTAALDSRTRAAAARPSNASSSSSNAPAATSQLMAAQPDSTDDDYPTVSGPSGNPLRLPVELFSSEDEGVDEEDLEQFEAHIARVPLPVRRRHAQVGPAAVDETSPPRMGPTTAAAEERWSAEKRNLEAELGWMRRQKGEDARVLQQTAALVGMLQESHRALVASNQRLLAQLAEEKERHRIEVMEHARQFEELRALSSHPP